MTAERLRELTASGWRITRDGSTSTAQLAHDEPNDPESGWELLVLYTSGHQARLTVNLFGDGLTERTAFEVGPFLDGTVQARELLESWEGEPCDETSAQT